MDVAPAYEQAARKNTNPAQKNRNQTTAINNKTKRNKRLFYRKPESVEAASPLLPISENSLFCDRWACTLWLKHKAVYR